MKKYKAVIIGYGYMGQIRHSLIKNHERFCLAGVCDTNSENLKNIKDCDIFSSYKECIDKTGAEIIFVCTPNLYSPDICVYGLEKGLNVFCEKPPGRSVADIERIIRAEKNGGKLMFGFNHRFHPAVMKAKSITESGKLGRIICINGSYGKSGGVNFNRSWRNDKKVSGGGILLDQGVHMLDLFQYLCDDFDQIKCFVNNSYWKLEVEDNALVMLQNKAGQSAVLHSSATMWKHTFRLYIILENGYMAIDGLLSKSGSYGRERLTLGRRQFENEANAVGNPQEEITYFDRDLSWNLEVDEFIECIDNDLPVRNSSSEDALKVMQIIEKAYKDAANFADNNLYHEKDLEKNIDKKTA